MHKYKNTEIQKTRECMNAKMQKRTHTEMHEYKNA